LRYCTPEGKLFLTPEETAEKEIKRAEKKTRKAKSRNTS
jgi:hypothetical protein